MSLINKKILGLIPARLNSTRLPEKPLANILGKTMIQRVYESAKESMFLSELLVLTDHAKIYDHVIEFGGKALMTSESCQTGTERILEAYYLNNDYDLYVNIQGDEPLVKKSHIDQVCELMIDKTEMAVGTLALPVSSVKEIESSNMCKVVLDSKGQAMYFSRSVIPFSRNEVSEMKYYKHMGLYSYTNSFLSKLNTFEGSSLEVAESLEQLKWLYNGVPIYVSLTNIDTIAVDTASDLEEVIKVLSKDN